MLLKDERFVDSTRGDITQYNAEWSEEDNEFIYVQGCYVIRYQANDVLTEDVSIALNGEGQVIQTTYQTLMSGEDVKTQQLLSDEEISERIKYIRMITPLGEGEELQNKKLDPYDWDLVDFVLTHRPDLMI